MDTLKITRTTSKAPTILQSTLTSTGQNSAPSASFFQLLYHGIKLILKLWCVFTHSLRVQTATLFLLSAHRAGLIVCEYLRVLNLSITLSAVV